MLYYDKKLGRRETTATLRQRGITEGVDLAMLEIYPLADAKPAAYDPRAYRFVDAGTVGDPEAGYRIDWQPVERPLPTTKEAFKASATKRRWAVEVGGTMFRGFRIQTDRESRATMALAYWRDGDAWKDADGVFRSLTVAEFKDMVAVAVAHVRAAYDRERDLHLAINAATTVTALLAIDVTAGWPGQE